jgi:glutamate dehydrogenase (NADP+)
MYLKNALRGRICEYVEKYPGASYVPADPAADHNALWKVPCDVALPCATQNEIGEADARNLARGGCRTVAEGANMPSTAAAVEVMREHGIRLAPAKAANAGGVAVSALEMSQNAMRMSWSREEVEERLRRIMKSIHDSCSAAAKEYGFEKDLVRGANIAGFLKVGDAMMDQGVV